MTTEFPSWLGNHISNSGNEQLPNLVLYIKKNPEFNEKTL